VRRSAALALVVLAAAGAGAGAWLAERPGGPARLEVTLDGAPVELPAGTTLGGALRRLGVSPERGDLLDVRGRVLERDRFPGYVLLDGVPRPPSTPLASGQAIQVVDGVDRREAVRVEELPVPGGQPSNPQFTLDRTPGVEVVARGVRSGKPLFAYFRPTGEPVAERTVALTFDDGPWPGSTRRILRVLARLHVPATFFTVGEQVERYPELVRLEARLGMAVGSHSWSHPYRTPFADLPRARLRAEVVRGEEALRAAGVEPQLFRPPGGSYSDELVELARRRGMRLVLWSVDPADWQPETTRKRLVRRVLRAVRPGSIVLLHDGGGDRSATVKALPAIVEGIRRRGLELVALA
jgi:peptidoglycan/xylan/chitin deacetylase (PgdA/CDA1 family)/sulfur carrier protein ThiS